MKQKYTRNKSGRRDDTFSFGYVDSEMPKEHPWMLESEICGEVYTENGGFGHNSLYVRVETTKVKRIQSKKSSG